MDKNQPSVIPVVSASRDEDAEGKGRRGKKKLELEARSFHKYGSRLTLPTDVSDFYSSCNVPLVAAGPIPAWSRSPREGAENGGETIEMSRLFYCEATRMCAA